MQHRANIELGEWNMRKSSKLWTAGTAAFLLVAGTVHAQTMPASAPPPGAMAPATQNPADAPAGAYSLDLEHSSVVARVPHRGMSFNVLRFGVKTGMMQWDPANPSSIALDVTVDAKPYYALIVYRILPEGPDSLDVAQFPEMRFVSTSIRMKDGNKADIEGQLTLMGVTKPAVIEAELVGVGRSMKGAPTVGFTGKMTVKAADFTDKQMARMVGTATIILDAEFIKG
jgi:polyisoprenoid-binding protein YceI